MAGLVTGALGLVIGIALAVSAGTFFSTHTGDFQQLGRCLDRATTDQGRATCARDFGDRLNR